jgi:hypothetical protein
MLHPLFAISHGSPEAQRIFTYLQRGPYANVDQMQAYLEAWCADPAVVAYVVKDNASGASQARLSLMNIRVRSTVSRRSDMFGTRLNSSAPRPIRSPSTCCLRIYSMSLDIDEPSGNAMFAINRVDVPHCD